MASSSARSMPTWRTMKVDRAATEAKRTYIRQNRYAWLNEDAEAIAAKYRSKDLDTMDLIRSNTS